MKKAKKAAKSKASKSVVKKKATARKKVAKKAVTKKKSVEKAATKKKTAAKKKATARKKVPKKKTAAKKKSAPRKKITKLAVPKKKPAKKVRKIRLTAKTLAEYKAVLMAMRQRLTGQIAALQGDSLQRQDAVNSEEDGTDAFERQFALNLASSGNSDVFEIDEALQRLEKKTFGVCEQCGGGIEGPRLKALPYARMCIGCKTANEKGTRRFRPNPV